MFSREFLFIINLKLFLLLLILSFIENGLIFLSKYMHLSTKNSKLCKIKITKPIYIFVCTVND